MVDLRRGDEKEGWGSGALSQDVHHCIQEIARAANIDSFQKPWVFCRIWHERNRTKMDDCLRLDHAYEIYDCRTVGQVGAMKVRKLRVDDIRQHGLVAILREFPCQVPRYEPCAASDQDLHAEAACLRARARSLSTIILTSSLKSTRGFQPSSARAFDASPSSCSTSLGRSKRVS